MEGVLKFGRMIPVISSCAYFHWQMFSSVKNIDDKIHVFQKTKPDNDFLKDDRITKGNIKDSKSLIDRIDDNILCDLNRDPSRGKGSTVAKENTVRLDLQQTFDRGDVTFQGISIQVNNAPDKWDKTALAHTNVDSRILSMAFTENSEIAKQSVRDALNMSLDSKMKTEARIVTDSSKCKPISF